MVNSAKKKLEDSLMGKKIVVNYEGYQYAGLWLALAIGAFVALVAYVCIH